MDRQLRLLIIEDSENDALLLLRELRKSNWSITSERVCTAEDMRSCLKKQIWDVIVCDYVMPNFSCLQALKVLKEAGLDIPFILVSGQITDDQAVAAMKAGAIAYVLKGSSSTDLLQAIQDAIVGKHYLSSTLSERAIGNYIQKISSASPEPFDTLSIREREVMQMVVQGMTSAEIGKKLFISPRTVDIHRANIMRKLGLKTRIDLVQIAQRQGILPPEFEITKN